MKLSQLKKGNTKVLFCIVIILGVLLLIGCGENGKDGSAGPAGPAGPPGVPGTAIETGAVGPETCVICHGTGEVADIAVSHPDPTNETVIISAITLTNTAGVDGGIPVVSFHLATAGGTPITDLDAGLDVDNFQFMMADLVPAGTDTQGGWGTWDSPYWERWTYERSDTSKTDYPQGTLANDGNGDYTYTFAAEFGSASALADAPDYDPTHPQRLYMRFDGRPDYPNISVGFLDFNVPAVGGSATELDLAPQRQYVTGNACKQCHGPNFERAGHADDYRDTRACVICHSPLGFDNLQTDPVEQNRGQFMQDTDAYASVFFHKIHDAIDIPHWTDMGRIDGLGYSAVTYPQDIRDCVVCHTDSGLDLGDQTDQIDNWKTHPTAEICGSCHDDVNFITGDNHKGGAWPDNGACALCHPASGGGIGGDITAAHDTTPTGRNVPEFDVTLTITPDQPSYAEGDVLQVRVTLTDHTDGLPVDPAIYTTPNDHPGVTGGGLSIARLSVYGPRAKAVPVLTTGTITDPAFNSSSGEAPRQYANLFIGGIDPRVTTDNSGFSYRLFPIPNDMVPGTYMVRVRIADYGRLRNDDYVIESTAFTTIQIGTDVEEDKVAGDACTNCHGIGKTPFHVETHAVAFDTDECLACHDQSGNFAIPIANRVHAIHSANPEGDIYNLDIGSVVDSHDWFHVTYPQDIGSCVTCHNSGNDTYKTLPYMMPCAGCHVGEAGDQDIPFEPVVIIHMRQYGGPY